MSVPGGLNIRIRRGTKVFHVYGQSAGLEGVWLAQGSVEGIYDAAVKTTWKTGAFMDGSRQKHRKWLHRDMELGFHIIETIATTWQFNDSEFRKMFDYQDDQWEDDPTKTVIEVDTDLSGTRKLDVLMYDAPVFTPKIDPHLNQHGFVIFKLRAGQPFWYEDDVMVNGVNSFQSTATSASGTVLVENPTDQIMYQYWVLTRAIWTLPDFQWIGGRGHRERGGDNGSRTVTMQPITELQGGAVVNLDPQELLIRDLNNTNILPQQNGKFFVYPIPPYTATQPLPVSYTGAPAGGARVELWQPRRWSRPWGLELFTGS